MIYWVSFIFKLYCVYTIYTYIYLIICSVIYILCLPCLCFLDFTDPEATKELAGKVTEYAENLMTAVREVLIATEVAFLKVPAKDRVHLTALNWAKK